MVAAMLAGWALALVYHDEIDRWLTPATIFVIPSPPSEVMA